jgi:chromate reductase
MAPPEGQVRHLHPRGSMHGNEIHWMGMAGSLRDGSFNRALLHAARQLTPDRARLEIFDLSELPLYNGDHDTDEARPERVVQLKQRIARCDGLVLVGPEYNYGVSGVLKNAIDWASRPAFDSPLTRKPVAIMGASMASTGTARGQQALRGVLLGCACVVYPAPDIAVATAQTKFDGIKLTHTETRDRLTQFLADYAAFTRMVARARQERLWPTEHA